MDNRIWESGASASPPAAPASPSSGYPSPGNPATGTPATKGGAFWFHQVGEEMRAVLTAAGITPSTANNAQLLEAIQRLIDAQSGNYALDTGAANAYVVALSPAITAYTDGMTVRVKVINGNTGASTLNAGGGVVGLVNDVGGALVTGDVPAASVFTATYITSADKFYITSLVPSQVALKSFNDITNGNFIIAQTGATFAANPYAPNIYDLDGWYTSCVLNGAGVTNPFTVSQVTSASVGGTGVTTNAGKRCRKVLITTAKTLTLPASDYLQLCEHKVEGSNLVKYVGKTFTIEFRAMFTKSGVQCISLTDHDATWSYVHEETFVANTWKTCTITVVGGLPANWPIASLDNTYGLVIHIGGFMGTNFHATSFDQWTNNYRVSSANQVNNFDAVNNVMAIEDVTMNLGTVASINEMSYADELRRCQTYFEQPSMGQHRIAMYDSNNLYGAMLNWNVPKRAIPTLSIATAPVVTSVNNVAQTGFTFSVDSLGGTLIRVNATKTAHGMGDGCISSGLISVSARL